MDIKEATSIGYDFLKAFTAVQIDIDRVGKTNIVVFRLKIGDAIFRKHIEEEQLEKQTVGTWAILFYEAKQYMKKIDHQTTGHEA